MKTAICFGLLLSAHWVAFAQPTVTARVEPNRVYANQNFTLEIVVSGTTQVERPRIPALSGLTASFSGQQSQSNFVNGRRSSSLRFFYTCRVSTVGVYTIGGIDVKAGGQILTTPLITIDVREPPTATDRLFVELRSQTETVFVGQQIELTLAIGVKPPKIGQRKLGGDVVFNADMWQRSNLGPFPRPTRYSEEQRTLENGKVEIFYVAKTKALVAPTEPGPLNLDQIVIGMRYPTRFRRDLFGQYRATHGETLQVVPPPSNVAVQALPSEGRPEKFNGAVGRYNLIANADTVEVRVGDPIQVELILAGDGAIEGIIPPDFKANDPLRNDFRVSDEQVGARFENGRKYFSFAVRARDPNVTEIPSFEFPYFEPESATYRVARSRPIPLQVTAVETLDLAAIEGLDSQRRETTRSTRLDGLRGNITSENQLLATQTGPSITGLFASQAIPAILFLAGALAARARQGSRRDDARQRRANAASTALQTLSHANRQSLANTAQAVLAALSGYLADRLNAPAERYQGSEALAALEELCATESLKNELFELVRRCEGAAYAGVAAEESEALIAAARQLIDRLEKLS